MNRQEAIDNWGIEDGRVLDAMRRVPREVFVPEALRACAYENRPLEIGHGQTISQPLIVGTMTSALELRGDERVLEIGTGCGYQTAVLSLLARSVYTVEIVPELARAARARLDGLGIGNVRFRVGDGSRGWPEEAPFDRVIVTAAPASVPKTLTDHLGPEGIMVIPVGTARQELIRLRRRGARLIRERLCGVSFVPMTGSAGRDASPGPDA